MVSNRHSSAWDLATLYTKEQNIMGYTTDFSGRVEITPPLNQAEIDFLKKFNNTRRMDRHNGPYFVDATGVAGQDDMPDVIDHNRPPQGQHF